MLKMSSLFLRTLRDDPADAEVASHKLLVRAGYVRRIAAGIYSWLPLGVITLRNIERVIREEMDAAGFQEVNFPSNFIAFCDKFCISDALEFSLLKNKIKFLPNFLTKMPLYSLFR